MGLSPEGRYLFVHRLFGISRRHFTQARRYTFYHHYALRWGDALPVSGNDLGADEVARVKRQIALEFLLWNYVTKTVDKTYGVASVRDLLLEVHALRYDMEYPGVVGGALSDLIHHVVAWRQVWFERPVGGDALNAWFSAFHPALQAFLASAFAEQKLFLPVWAGPRYAPHIRVERADRLACAHRGIRLPFGTHLPPTVYRLTMAALTRFRFTVPATGHGGGVLEDRFRFLETAKAHNAARLRRFDPPGSVLALRLLRGLHHPVPDVAV